MTMSEPNPSVGPTGGEAVEFVDAPDTDRPAPRPARNEDPDRPDAPQEPDPSDSLPPGAGRA